MANYYKLLNDVHPKPKNVINLLVLVTKQYIFACKCKGCMYHIQELKTIFNSISEAERYKNNAGNNASIARWEPFYKLHAMAIFAHEVQH